MFNTKKTKKELLEENIALRRECARLEKCEINQKQTEEALKKSVKEIEFFAYSVTHDLKSPAIAIHGLTNRLKKFCHSRLEEKGQDYCDLIVKAATDIMSLVEQINIFIKTKETPLEIKKINVNEILQSAKEKFTSPLKARQIAFYKPVRPIKIRADKSFLQRAFLNLIDNAIKYGGKELTEIKINFKTTEDFHVFSVSDNGQGVNGGNPRELFKMFRRASASKDVDGSGLGLAIVKEVAELHKGRVWATSGKEKGANFHFSIARNL